MSKERPILMQGAMVRKTLADLKTNTRRVEKAFPRGGSVQQLTSGAWEWSPDGGFDHGVVTKFCPYGTVGDRLWVRETFAPHDQAEVTNKERSHVYYRADDETKYESDGRWRPSIFMPRWASRITLEITGVRVERVQDISEEDANAEGCAAKKPWDMWHVITERGSYSIGTGNSEPVDGDLDRTGNKILFHHKQRVSDATTCRDEFRDLWNSGHLFESGKHGKGEWSPCDERCTHQGPLRVGSYNASLEFQGVCVEHPKLTAAQILERGSFVEAKWRILTVHHLTGDKADDRWFNTLALCQRCHLTIQGKVDPRIPWFLEHSTWFKPYAAAWYAHKYEGRSITREEAEARMDELLAYECRIPANPTGKKPVDAAQPPGVE